MYRVLARTKYPGGGRGLLERQTPAEWGRLSTFTLVSLCVGFLLVFQTRFRLGVLSTEDLFANECSR